MSIFNNDDLRLAAQNLNDAKVAFRDRWNTHRADTNGELLDPDRFWDIWDKFAATVGKCLELRGKREASKAACDELFRLQAVNELDATFDELLQFINNWDAISSALHSVLWEVVEDKSDDGYGDLTDSLPLVGREGVAKLLNGDAKDNNDVKDIITQQNDGMLDYIWNGENYFSMFLGDAAKKWYPLVMDENPSRHTEPRLV